MGERMLEKIALTPEQAKRCALALGCTYVSTQIYKAPADMGMPPEPPRTAMVWTFPDQDYVEESLSTDPKYWESLLWQKLKKIGKGLISLDYWPNGLYEHDTGPRTEIYYEKLHVFVDDILPCIAICMVIERIEEGRK